MHTPPSDTETLSVGPATFSFGDIRSVVERFYSTVEHDPILSVPFGSVQDWPHHIERLTHFWWTRFGGMAYMDVMYDPIGKHLEAGFNEEFLSRWLELFESTARAVLRQEQAEVWALITQRMGHSLLVRNNQYRQMLESERAH